MYNQSKKIGIMSVNVKYFHQKKSVSLDWSGLSIDSSGGISTGFDIESSTYYEDLGDVNVVVAINYK